jgi:hypothetical protein
MEGFVRHCGPTAFYPLPSLSNRGLPLDNLLTRPIYGDNYTSYGWLIHLDDIAVDSD